MGEHRKSVTARYLSARVRKRLYAVAVAALAVAVGYGILTEDQAYLWAGLLVPVLGVALDNVTE